MDIMDYLHWRSDLTFDEYKNNFSGVIVVNKEKNCTSFDIVNKISHLFGIKKVGHTGTLDPDAEGTGEIAAKGPNIMLGYYNDEEIEYDSIGNPTSYLGATLSWRGRELAGYSKGNKQISYSYDVDGMDVPGVIALAREEAFPFVIKYDLEVSSTVD